MSENNEIQNIPKQELSTNVDNFLNTWNHQKKIATELLKSGFLPKIYITPEQVVAVMLKGRELGLPPLEAIQRLFVINGKIGMEGQLMVALANRSGVLEDLQITFDGEGIKLVCKCRVKRKDREWYESTFSIEEAIKAGLMGKENTWAKYPKDMLQWRAISRNFRITFSDYLAGVYLPEELTSGISSEDAEYEEIFNEEYEFKRLHTQVQEYTKNPTLEKVQAFLDINKESLEKLSEVKRNIIMRFIDSAKEKFTKEINKENSNVN